MNSINKNIIQKTIVDLHYNGRIDPFQLQKEIGDWSSVRLSAIIEETLETYTATEECIKIDKLDVELNVDGKDDWMEAVSKKISELIAEKLAGISVEKKADGYVKQEKQKHFPISATREQNFYEAFIWFLQNGYMPWWSAIKNKSEFREEYSVWIRNEPDEYMIAGLTKLCGDETVQQRITDQLPADDFFVLIKILYGKAGSEMMKLLNDIVNLAALIAVEKRSAIEMEVKKLFWKQSGNENKMEALENIAEECVGFIYPGVIDKINSVQLGSAILKKELKKVKGTNRDVPAKKTNNFDIHAPVTAKEENDSRIQKKIKEREAVYINNAGLVIIAPFLPLFFKKLNITQEDSINDECLAVCLVKYLADQEENIAEFELGLAKLLCGIELEKPVSTMVTFTDDQKNEANELLLSVIEYWKILKDTSVEGLQQSFLQREGKLSFADNEWLLQVEQKGYDMLLKHLPWNISMIRLPWMHHLLKTEWVY